jgi:NADH:ubiquinone reductase (H+-translocating)
MTYDGDMSQQIVIVGGGFGGVTAALHLAKAGLKNTTITLISDRPWLEYYGVLYRIIGGADMSEACLPLNMIVGKLPIQIVIDSVKSIDAKKKNVEGKSKTYAYDTLILAPGSVASYFGIPGMEEHSITLRHAADALDLRTMILKNMKSAQRWIVVGGGPTGIEIAGEIRHLSHGKIGVDMIEATDRLLPFAEPKASAKVLQRVKRLGVNVLLNTAVAKAVRQSVTLKDGTTMKGSVIVWTAGVKAHPMIAAIKGLEVDKRGRAVVDAQLRSATHPDIIVLGDCASTPYAGMAQTAVDDGVFIAKVLKAEQLNSPVPAYNPRPPAYAIPAGPYWAAVKYGPLRVYGFFGYMMRRAADIHVYMLILRWRHVPAAYLGRINLKRYGINIDR